MEFNEEFMSKVKNVKSVEEAIQLAKECGTSITPEQAKELLAKVKDAPELLKGLKGKLFG